MKAVSRGFASALAGVGATILAWIGPWAWPAWPALLVMRMAFPPERSFAALPIEVRCAVAVLLIGLNVAVWGVVTAIVSAPCTAARRREREAATQ